jgi:hypothetical protein
MGREWEGTDTDEDNDNNNMTSHCDSLVKAPLIASRDLGKRQGSAILQTIGREWAGTDTD